MRNIANGLFVVIFIYIIYGYLVGRAESNYSIKRLLPRLLIAAITLNLSYYIGVLMVDVSNIIGDSIWSIMKGIYGSGSPVMPLGASANPLSDGNITKMAAAAVGNTQMVWVLLPPIITVAMSIAVISGATVILIIMREAVVATLLLAAPILLVLRLLPNTEHFSNQGMRLFMQLLLLYPIIALLLGAGQIVSVASGSWDNQSASYGGGTHSIVPDIVASAAAVVPLLGVWFLFKGLSSVMSTAGSRLSATIGGRKGQEDKKARVTGKATVGAANAKNATGLGNIIGRRQAFSRNRHRSSLGNSSPVNPSNSTKPRLGENQPTTNTAMQDALNKIPGNALSSAISNASSNSLTDLNNKDNEKTSDDISKHLEELQEANLEAEGSGMKIDGATANIEGGKKDDEKHITAKDLFNNLNKSHESKDKDRKLSAGPPPAGANNQATGTASQPSAPTVSYRAPSMAQGNNIVSGTSIPTQPTQVIAVPIQIDSSSLLGNNQHKPPENIAQPPISGTEEKAKARAQKYLYEADKDLDEARDKQDILGHKDDTPTEPPHVSTHTEDDDNKDSY